MANYRLIAVQIGDALKYNTSVNEINRIAGAVFRFRREDFPNDSITSSRAQLIHDWILSLAKQAMESEERHKQLIIFCEQLAPENGRHSLMDILHNNGIPLNLLRGTELKEFYDRDFHPAIIHHCRKLFLEGNYFHAVFEACKVYNNTVKQKSQSTKDGEALMMDVWGWQNGVLKITSCASETDKNVQDGIKFLSSGLMRAIRNPTAHEPALDWPISKQDCLDILSFLSFLFRQIESAVYYKA